MRKIKQRLLLTSAVAIACALPAIASAQWGGVPGGWGGPGWGNSGYGNGSEYANGYGRGAGRMGGRAQFCFDGDVGGMMDDFFGTNGWGNNGWGSNGWGNNGWGNGWGNNGWGNGNGRGYGRGFGRGWGKGRVCVSMDANGSMDDFINGNGWGNNGWGNNGGGWGGPWRRGWW